MELELGIPFGSPGSGNIITHSWKSRFNLARNYSYFIGTACQIIRHEIPALVPAVSVDGFCGGIQSSPESDDAFADHAAHTERAHAQTTSTEIVPRRLYLSSFGGIRGRVVVSTSGGAISVLAARITGRSMYV
jgi:hypothetical protein